MRIRTIKPEFWTSEGVASVSMPARLTFIGIWNMADDHGRSKANPAIVKAALWPLDDDVPASQVALWLAELHEAGLIQLYEVEGRTYLHVPSWEKHQASAYRRGEPQYPAPPVVQERAGREGKGREQGTGKGTGIAPVNGRVRDPVWDAFVEMYGEPTDVSRGAWNAAAKTLRDYGATGPEIQAFYLGARSSGNDRFVITPTALAKHYGSREMLSKTAPKADHAAQLLREAMNE